MKMTKDLWETLSGKERWDLMVAMRGPDVDNSQISLRIKTLTTAVLRGVMQDVYRVGGTIGKPKSIVVPEDVHKSLFPGALHFFGHIYDAAHILTSYDLLKTETVPSGIYKDYIVSGLTSDLIPHIPFFIKGTHLP
jgi:hypothetical protein